MADKVTPTKRETLFSIGLVPTAVVILALFGWATVKISPLFIAGIFLPVYMVGASCAGMRVLRGESPINP